MFNTASGIYAPPSQRFTEDSRSTPWGSTRIQESSQSALSIKCLPSNYVLSWIVLQMTIIPDISNVGGLRYWSRDRLWPDCGDQTVRPVIRHHNWECWSPIALTSCRLRAPGPLITTYNVSTSRETAPCWYRDGITFASKFPKSSWGNGTIIAQTPKVNSDQEIVWLPPFTIGLGTTTTQVLWSPECSTTQVQWSPECTATQGRWWLECSPTAKGYCWCHNKVHGGNFIHEDSLAYIFWWQVVNGCWSLETSH